MSLPEVHSEPLKEPGRSVVWWRRLAADWLERAKIQEQSFMIAVAILIGVACGFGAVGFKYLLHFMLWFFWGTEHIDPGYLQALPHWRLILMPVAGGLIVGPIVFILVREAKGHGVPEVMAAVAVRDGLIQGRVALAKAFASAVTIGSGGSAGPEGPIIQIGAAIGSKVGQLVQVSRKKLRTFVACGAAAGLAATFNAPIAGSLFAVEVILGQFGVAQFSPIVISAVIATVISRYYHGGEAVFSIPDYELVSMVELGPYLLLGVLCGLLSVVLIRALYWSEDTFKRVPKVPAWLKPAIGGLMLGAMAWMIPHVYGDGELVINMILSDQLGWGLLLVLIFAKLLATVLTLGSGGSGGVFAPSLFLGAALGGCVGYGVSAVLGESAGAPGGYALVGMGGLVAGTIHAPITAIIMIFEITDNYTIILPLMLVCIISILIATRFHRESIYTTKLLRQGIDIFRGQPVDVMKNFTVRQAIHAEYAQLAPETPVKDIVERAMQGENTQFYVVDEGERLHGVVLLGELSRVLSRREGLDQVLLAEDLAHTDVPVCTPQESLSRVLLKFEHAGLTELPVVDALETYRLCGVLRYREVIALYNNEMMKRDMADSLATRMGLSDRMEKVRIADGISMVEWEPPPTMWGRTLADIQMPTKYNARVMMVKRKTGQAEDILPISPGPNFIIQSGDTFIIYGPDTALEKIPTV
jgi:chloride channel protein, CIC family